MRPVDGRNLLIAMRSNWIKSQKLAGYYVNELILHFLHRHDPQPDVFDAYAQTITALATAGEAVAPCLRRFEVELLRQVGYALSLDHEYGSQRSLDAESYYEYRVEQGAVAVSRTEGSLVFTGEMLTAIHEQRFGDTDVLRAASRLLREVISFHLGGKELKSRKVLLEVRGQFT